MSHESSNTRASCRALPRFDRRWGLVAASLLVLACSSPSKHEASAADDDGDDDGEQENPAGSLDASAGSKPRDAATGPARSDAGTTAARDASSSIDASGASADATVPVDTSRFDWIPGDYPPGPTEQTYLELKDLPNQAGNVRGYKVHVPKTYNPVNPAPIVFAMHGLGQNAVMFGVQGTTFMKQSDDNGFILVLPNGVGNSWNAGVCCGGAATSKLDDVGFIRAIYAEVDKHVHLDKGRVYATGLSNGAFMAHRLACDAADLFVAVAPLAGSIGTSALGAIGTNPDPDLKVCSPSQPVAVLMMHGSGDPIVPYAGMKPSLDFWAKNAGCSTTTRAAAQPASGGDTTCTTFEGCREGIEVTGCTVDGGGHCWFGDETCGTGAPGIGPAIVGKNSDTLDATTAAWQFVSRFRR